MKIDITPEKIEFPILYKYTTKGQVQQWQIVVDGDSFYTIEGIKGGKLTTSLPTICKPKNIGKKNETTARKQAEIEAKSKFKKKSDKGYNEILQKDVPFFEPMLAEKFYEKHFSFNEDGHKKVFVQPKLDGLRCSNREGSLMSRNGKPYYSCPHLHQSEVHLDGELYNHTLRNEFNSIVSLCKKQNPTQDQIEDTANIIQHWVYDFPAVEDVFSKRYEKLKEWFFDTDAEEKGFVLVPTYEVKSIDEIKEWHSKFISEGYEGTIIRIDLGPYENKRSKQLLKYKDFIDEEFKIVGFMEGEGGRVGTIGKFILQHDKNPSQTFESNVKGNFEYLREVWKNRDTYIGKTATVKYFNRTPKKKDGGDVPRFGFVIKIDRESYE